MTIITSTNELNDLCELITKQNFITIDTEFLRDKTYFSKLCLMQIGLDNCSIIIDTLSPLLDLSPLFRIFDDPKIVKVFHAAAQDLEIIFSLYGKIPYPIFDTQVAAMFCGLGNAISYNNLSMKLIGIKIDKTYQFTDWSSRPLSEEQINYALNDVHYLRTIYEKLCNKLLQLKRCNWMQEEMNLISNIDNYILNPEKSWLKIKANYQNANIELLKKLATWREITAQTINIPRGHLIKDEILVEICKTIPGTVSQLKNMIPKYSKYFFNDKKLIDELFTLIEPYYGSDKLFTKLESPTSLPYNKNLYSLLKLLLSVKSLEYNIAASTIISNEELMIIASSATLEQLNKLKSMQGWRYKIFGSDTINLQQGKIALTIENNQIFVLNL